MSSFPDLITAFEEAVEALKVKLSQDPSARITYNGEEIQSIAQDVAEYLLELAIAQRQGLVSFATYAELTSYTPLVEQEKASFKVGKDPDSSKNGYYRWVSGTTYDKDSDLVLLDVDENNTSESISGSGIAEYAIGATSKKNITGSFIDNSLISGVNGADQSNENYKRTDFIEVEEGALVTYVGACRSQTGMAFYDKDKNFISGYYADLDQNRTVIERKTLVSPASAKFYRACFDKREPNIINAAILTMSVPLQALTSGDGIDVKRSVAFSHYVLGTENINLINQHPIIKDRLIIADTGVEAISQEYDATDFIPINKYPWNGIFEGFIAGQAGFSAYDENKQFIEKIVEGGNTGGLNEYQIKITNENVKYIRLCNKKSVTSAFNLNQTYGDVSFNQLFEDKELISASNTINDQMIDADNGSAGVNDAYDRTDFIAVDSEKHYRWTGYVAIRTGIAGYDENKQFVDAILYPSRDGYVTPVEEFDFKPAPEIKFIRSCTKKTEATRPHSLRVLQPKIDPKINEKVAAVESEIEKQSYVDLVNRTTIINGEGINTSTGNSYKNEATFCTGYIPVTPNEKIEFEGRTISLTGIAGYDKNKNYVVAISPSAETFHDIYTVPDNVFYIRATSYLNYPLSLKSSLISPELEQKAESDIYIEFIDSNKFNVNSKCPDGSYCTHRFELIERPQFSDYGWYTPSVYHNGNIIAQGNLNCIHIMLVDSEAGNDNMYVGIMHGCEKELYSQFFLDGERFDPITEKDKLYGTEFRMQMLTEFYTPDKQASIDSGTEYTVAKLPLETRATRFSEYRLKGNNVITRYHKVKNLMPDARFSDFYGTMQQTNPPTINGIITTNDRDGLRNHFPNAPEVPEALAPSTVVMNGSAYGDKNSFATTVTAEGEDSDYSYLVSTTAENADSSQRWKCHLRAWLTRTTAHKMYFQPIITTNINQAYPEYPVDVFQPGELIEVKSETTFKVTKK
ncbi:hypothetical protein ACSVUS_003718 [Vibrio alginolyticus]|uniref:hypothetical protein n=1 Tax=Vibrio diabolicus TaxID=50719 RepID=UPI002480A308|nr:hypothetical protein [Vibrio diabolicus]EIU6819582.1 hypothetical protein [Vibrio parahaemolyticus]EJL6724392.1 hypothetical protein [Vibrio alginolyticus]